MAQKIQTTFGVVTIFKNKNTDKKSNENRIIEKKDEEIESDLNKITKKTTKIENKNENFFGLEDNTMDKDKSELNDLNYFDEQLIKDYKDKKHDSIDLTNMKKEVKVDKTDLNYIDDYYFNNRNNLTEKINNTNLKVNNITKSDITSSNNLNYFDEMVFKSVTQDDDKTLGSILSFKKENVPKIQKENPVDQIPLISTNDYPDDEEHNERKFRNILKSDKKIEEKLKESKHKELDKETPKWYDLTIDEAANILKNHVCYVNEEQGILAIDKPYGLPCMGGAKVHLSVAKLLPSLQNLLKLSNELYMAHRLDEFTTGIMLFGMNKDSAKKLHTLFSERKIIKQYLAITRNIPKLKEGEINIPLVRRIVNNIEKTYISPDLDDSAKQVLDKPRLTYNDTRKTSITKYRVLDSANQSALIELQPLTGFQHQIRAHLAYGLGCPILGDHKYSHDIKIAPQKLPDEMLKRLNIRQSKVRYVPLHLHSYRIILPEFWQNTNVFITAKLPLHFINNLKRLKLRF